MDKNCFFCNLSEERKIINGNLAFVIEDGFPVTKVSLGLNI